MVGKILITGATGNIGSEVLNELVESGLKVKAAVHTMEKVQKFDWDIGNVEIVPFDYAQPKTWESAFENVEQLLLVAPPGDATAHQLLIPFIIAAKTHGIQKIVMISAVGVDKDDTIPLRIIEQYLINCGIDFVILRCNWIMQNFLTTFGNSIRKKGLIEAPAGDRKISFIDARDIGEFATEMFRHPHYNQIFTLTGKEALGFYSVARILSAKLDRDVKYLPQSEEDARKQFLAWGMPPANVELYLGLYQAVREGGAEIVSKDFKKHFFGDPMSFEDFVDDYLMEWKEMEQLLS
jgi:uncharacterized protein YbjT (DUF2867 family)